MKNPGDIARMSTDDIIAAVRRRGFEVELLGRRKESDGRIDLFQYTARKGEKTARATSRLSPSRAAG